MDSNHRLVLFTHALCRLSYLAINENLLRPFALADHDPSLKAAACVHVRARSISAFLASSAPQGGHESPRGPRF